MGFLYEGVVIEGGDLLVLAYEELDGEKSEILWRVPAAYKRDLFWNSGAGEKDFYGLKISGKTIFPHEIRHATAAENFTDLAGRQPLDFSELKEGDRLLIVFTPEHEVDLKDAYWDGDAVAAKAYAKQVANDYLDRWELRVTLSEEGLTWFSDEPDFLNAFSMREIDLAKGGAVSVYRA